MAKQMPQSDLDAATVNEPEPLHPNHIKTHIVVADELDAHKLHSIASDPKGKEPVKEPEPARRTDSDEVKQIEAERAEVALFVREHPCPSRTEMLQWITDALGSGELDMNDDSLKNVLKDNFSEASLDLFSYRAFQALYEAPLQANERDESRIQRNVGAALHKRGGEKAMLLHYRLVEYTMNSPYFFGQGTRPLSVRYYVRVVEDEWTGIGQWLS